MRSSGGSLRVGALGTLEVPEGTLAYVGSAYGPGGIAARVSRHFRRGKRLRWHIDYLTESSLVEVEGALALPSIGEGELLELMVEFGEPVIPGFGCSDSRGDLTHLFKLKDLGRLKEFLIDKYSAQELRSTQA